MIFHSDLDLELKVTKSLNLIVFPTFALNPCFIYSQAATPSQESDDAADDVWNGWPWDDPHSDGLQIFGRAGWQSSAPGKDGVTVVFDPGPEEDSDEQSQLRAVSATITRM